MDFKEIWFWKYFWGPKKSQIPTHTLKKATQKLAPPSTIQKKKGEKPTQNNLLEKKKGGFTRKFGFFNRETF